MLDKLTTTEQTNTQTSHRPAGSYSWLSFSRINYNKPQEKKVSPVLRVAWGQRGAFPKDAIDFNCVPERALPPAWPRISTQGLEAFRQPQHRGRRGKKNLLRRIVHLRSLEVH